MKWPRAHKPHSTITSHVTSTRLEAAGRRVTPPRPPRAEESSSIRPSPSPPMPHACTHTRTRTAANVSDAPMPTWVRTQRPSAISYCPARARCPSVTHQAAGRRRAARGRTCATHTAHANSPTARRQGARRPTRPDVARARDGRSQTDARQNPPPRAPIESRVAQRHTSSNPGRAPPARDAARRP